MIKVSISSINVQQETQKKRTLYQLWNFLGRIGHLRSKIKDVPERCRLSGIPFAFNKYNVAAIIKES